MVAAPVLLAAESSIRLFGKQPVVTSIYRSEAEHRALCARLGVAPYASVHTYWRGVDLRSWIYSDDEIRQLLEIINSRFDYGRSKSVAICHDVGAGRHFHIQAPEADGVWRP